ncbi:MAG: hypothetical protein ACKOQ2_15530, partial [Dolichospermum sp.]
SFVFFVPIPAGRSANVVHLIYIPPSCPLARKANFEIVSQLIITEAEPLESIPCQSQGTR